MKKYTDDHLESACPAWVVAVEKWVAADDGYGCIEEYASNNCKSGFDSRFCDYNMKIFDCPCWHFGSPEKAKKEMNNLIRQWKAWAGVTE